MAEKRVGRMAVVMVDLKDNLVVAYLVSHWVGMWDTVLVHSTVGSTAAQMDN